MKLYSGKGDLGTTDNFRKQVSKNDELIHFLGDLDELNCYLGLVKALVSSEGQEQNPVCVIIETIQKNITKIMANVTVANNSDGDFLSENDIKKLEQEIDLISQTIPKQKHFVLPGKSITEAHIQVTRAITRRVERSFFAVNKNRKLDPQIGVYLNRLSDYLFVLSICVD